LPLLYNACLSSVLHFPTELALLTAIVGVADLTLSAVGVVGLRLGESDLFLFIFVVVVSEGKFTLVGDLILLCARSSLVLRGLPFAADATRPAAVTPLVRWILLLRGRPESSAWRSAKARSCSRKNDKSIPSVRRPKFALSML
jgi:hypothetical protein